MRYQCGPGEYDASGERHFCRCAVRSLGMGDIRAASSTLYNGEARKGQGVSLLDRREIDGSERVRTPHKARHEFSIACRYRGYTLRMVDVATFDPLLYSVETRIRDRVFRNLVAIPFKSWDWTLLIFSNECTVMTEQVVTQLSLPSVRYISSSRDFFVSDGFSIQ